jgi:hypothetical protein
MGYGLFQREAKNQSWDDEALGMTYEGKMRDEA